MSPRLPLAAAAALALAAVAAALVSQHRFDMQPCPWCVLQRLEFLLVALAAALAAAVPAGRLRAALGALALVFALAGVATALWQHFVAAASASCNLTLADRIMSATGLDMRFPEVFAAYASCAEAKATVMGVPYEFLSLALFVLIGALVTTALRRRAR